MFKRLSAKIRSSSPARKRASSKVEPAAQEDQSLKWLKAIHNAQKGTGISGRTLAAMSPDRLELDQEPYLSPSHSESDFLYNTVESGSQYTFFSPESSPSHFESDLLSSYEQPPTPESPPLSPSSEAASPPRSDLDSAPESEPSSPDYNSCSASGFELEDIGSPRFDVGVEGLNTFLQESKYRFEDRASDATVKVVLGNEASDLDSIVSSIAYARLLAATRSSGSTVILPLVNIPRKDWPLRTEAAYLFSSMGLSVETLLFIDEVDLNELFSRGRLEMVLVDHNRLARSQEHLSRSIVEIVDHHEPENLYPWVEDRLIEQVGSCCTLVAERISEQAPELLQGRGLSKLLLSAILLDTSNLDDTMGRSTELDEIMAALLVNGAGTLGRYGLFELLKAKRFDQSGLGTADLLRKDYKQWLMGPGVNVGISSVGLPLRKIASKDKSFKSEVKAFAAQHDLGVLVIMSMFYDVMGNFKRQIAIMADNEALVRDISKFLASPAAGLKLTANPAAGFPDFSKVYNQTCLTASRKKVQPLLAEFFESKMEM